MDNKINLILGTMNFGIQVNQENANEISKMFIDFGYKEFDTAFVYNDGKSEEILGNCIKDYKKDSYSIATKVNPRITGKLDYESIHMQFNKSLDRLCVDSVDILYLHFPDPNTPIESTLKACAELHEKGKFKELGLSNFPAWMVVDAWYTCKKNGWILPTVYQGVYNALSRKSEEELFPALRKLGIRFYAYNPLAGGILSGKYKNFEENPTIGRFVDRPNYKDRYWKPSYFAALKSITKLCEHLEITLVEASYRWLTYHSCLDSQHDDGILIGVSKLNQLEGNLQSIRKGPLPSNIIDAFEKAWQVTKSDSPSYFRQATQK